MSGNSGLFFVFFLIKGEKYIVIVIYLLTTSYKQILIYIKCKLGKEKLWYMINVKNLFQFPPLRGRARSDSHIPNKPVYGFPTNHVFVFTFQKYLNVWLHFGIIFSWMKLEMDWNLISNPITMMISLTGLISLNS